MPPQKVISPSPWEKWEIAHGEVRPVHEHRVEDPGALGEVLDVLVAAVLARWRGTGAFTGHAIAVGLSHPAEDRAVRLRRQSERGHPVRFGGDQRRLAGVPCLQQLGRGGGAHQAGVDHPGELDAGHVARGGLVAAEVPDGLVGVGELVGEEAAAVALGEDAGVAPALPRQRAVILLRDRAHIQDVDDQQVAGLRTLDAERPGEGVHGVQGCCGDVLGGIIVLDVAVEPFAAVDPEDVAGVDADGRRDVRMPTVVTEDLLLGEGFRGVEREHVLGHASPSTATGPLRGPARFQAG